MAQTYETRRRSAKHEGSDAKVQTGQAPETNSRTEKNMSKKNAVPTQTEATTGVVSEGEYKGKPVLSLLRNAEDKKPLRFGFVKAGLILAHLEDIKSFRAKHAKQEASVTA